LFSIKNNFIDFVVLLCIQYLFYFIISEIMENIGNLLSKAKTLTVSKKTINSIKLQMENTIRDKGENWDELDEYIRDHQYLINNENSYIKEIEESLIQAKKELFDAIEKNRIPAEKLPILASFFSSEHLKLSSEKMYSGVDKLFDAIDVDHIPAEKTPTVICFLADYLESSYKKAMIGEVKKYSKEKLFVEQTNMNCSIYDADFSVRLRNVLKNTDEQTVGEIMKSFKDDPKFLLSYRGLGKKSNEELKKVLEEDWLI